MSSFFAFLGLGVGGAALFLASALNRGASKLEGAARARVRQRFAQRASMATSDLLSSASIPVDLRGAATDLVTRVGSVLGVDPGTLRAEDRLGEVLRVNSEELPSIKSDDWGQAGLPMYIVVHTYDLMHLVETYSDRLKWKAKWASLPAPPRNEEQWIDLILVMTVGEFLSFFAPLAKN
jgi:hypothetical protein